MPKSKNKRKNGGKGGTVWAKRVAKAHQEKQAKEQSAIDRIKREMLG